MKLELMTSWYNEEFLSPFFVRHYQFVDCLHVFLDVATTDGTRRVLEDAQGQFGHIQIHDCQFPDQLDDILKIDLFNAYYPLLTGDYVFVVDADEFVFYPQGYLEAHPAQVHFTKLWNVYRHVTEHDLDSTQPIRTQRRHGVSACDGIEAYTKPNLVKTHEDLSWSVGHHLAWLNQQRVDFYQPRDQFPDGVYRGEPLSGAHWAMADPAFVVARRLERQRLISHANVVQGFGKQYQDLTLTSLHDTLRAHEHDPQVL